MGKDQNRKCIINLENCKSDYHSSGTAGELNGLFARAASIIGWGARSLWFTTINLAAISDLDIA